MLPRFFSSNGIVFELLLKEHKSITYKTGCMLQRNSCLEWEMYAGCLIHQDFSSISNGGTWEQKHKHQMHSLGQLCFAPEAWNHAQLSRAPSADIQPCEWA